MLCIPVHCNTLCTLNMENIDFRRDLFYRSSIILPLILYRSGKLFKLVQVNLLVSLFIFARYVKDWCNYNIEDNCVNTTNEILNDNNTRCGRMWMCFLFGTERWHCTACTSMSGANKQIQLDAVVILPSDVHLPDYTLFRAKLHL